MNDSMLQSLPSGPLPSRESGCIDGAEVERLLLPVGRRRHWPGVLNYVRHRMSLGRQPEVCLLRIERPSGCWLPDDGRAVLRERVDAVLRGVCSELAACGIAHAVHLRSASRLVFAILDAAEELNCSAILVPPAASGWRRIFSSGTVAALCAGQRNVPVITVDGDGRPRAWTAQSGSVYRETGR